MTQSQKTLAQLVAFLAIGAALGGYAYFGVFKKDAAEAEKKDHDLRLFAPQKLGEKQPDGGSPPAEFTKITVTFEGETTVLEREPGTDWRLVSPVVARADKLVMDSLTSQLQTSRFKATLEENPDQATLERYGLDKPRFTVEAVAQVNGETRTVKLVGGIENPFDGSVFMRRNDDPSVYTAEGGARYALARKTFDLREKAIFTVDESKLVRIATRSKSNDWVLERGADKTWNLVKPTSEPADATTVSAMLGAMNQERAQAFFDDTPEQRKAFGLDQPLVETNFLFDSGTKRRVLIGRPGEGDTLYALVEDEVGTVLAQVGTGATQYDRHTSDLKDKSLVRFKKELVTKISFRPASGDELVVSKDSVDASAEAWRVVAPRAGKAKVFKVTSVLWTLGSLKGSKLVEEKPKDLERYGLGKGARAIVLFGEDGAELARFTIGREQSGAPNTFFVRGSGDAVFEMDGGRFTEFPFALADLLDEPGEADGGATGG
jgi:hypothetical protein